MVNMVASSAVDCEFEPRLNQTKDYKMVFVASPLSMQHLVERAKTGWLGIKIMCRSGATCLSADRCFSELAL
jgi:uroporphyrinogen-III synthase